jgi:hypothetical protein
MSDVRVLRTLQELGELVARDGELFVRYSDGPDTEPDYRSTDYESGLELPGLSVNPLRPEPWWTRPLEDWLARQICNYVHLADHDEARHGWVLSGRVTGRGPDNEPLVKPARVIGLLDDSLIEDARALYHERFEVGRDSTSD